VAVLVRLVIAPRARLTRTLLQICDGSSQIGTG